MVDVFSSPSERSRATEHVDLFVFCAPEPAYTGSAVSRGGTMSDSLRIRLSTEDALALRRAATAARLNVSAYVRALLFSEQGERMGFTLGGVSLGVARRTGTIRDGERGQVASASETHQR
jgi:hypothetical protein